MNTLNILLLSVLGALVLACIVGVAVGRHQAKKAAGQVRELLSPKERAIYAASVVVGVALLLVGILYQGPAQRPDEWDFMGSDRPHFEGEAPVAIRPPARPAPGGGGGFVIVG